MPSVFFGLLGSALIKAAHKMLVKLIPGAFKEAKAAICRFEYLATCGLITANKKGK